MDLASYASWAVDLANTWDPKQVDPERLPDLPALRAYLRDEPTLVADATEDDLVRLREVRGGIRAVAEAPDERTAMGRLNVLLAGVRAVPEMSGHDGEPWHLHLTSAGSPVSDHVATRALLGLAAQLNDTGWERLGQCQLSDCWDVYIDTSSNRSRRYCSDACTNRANVRAHRARRKAASGA